MHTIPLAHVRSPYGIAFSIEDLVRVKSWAERRGLTLHVATDQVLDGAEFEEVLILAPRARDRRVLTLWRNHSAVFAQMPQSAPRGFENVADALESLRPASRPRAAWMRILGLAG